ncbi:MAG: sulfotransferase [Gammaproteobacteria bacterium]|nr:sulfotransferase [Gammaproteobacteria bacterium]
MSKKQRKVRKKTPRAARPMRPLSPQQSMRLQQAVRAHSAGDLALAESAYRALIAEKIRTPDIYCKLAAVCVQTGRRGEAVRLWKMALAIDPGYLEASMNLADSYQLSGDLERSEKLYRRIIADHKQLHVARYLLANLLKSQGKFAEASEFYAAVMEQQPDYTQAHFSYAQIHKYRDRADPHIGQMLDLLRSGDLQPGNRIQLSFALAKAFENIGDYAAAFEHLKTGNDLRKVEFNYDIESDRALIRSIIRCFSQEEMSRIKVPGEDSRRPIFILGMPRSGTSLVEKIIASHSDVHGAGELEYIFALGTRLFLQRSADFQFGHLDAYPRSAFEEFGRAYLAQIRALNDQAGCVTDKMPFNMMMIGLIRLALPNARIIHCVRDARDTCLSIYKQNFTTGNYRFAYDLKAIAQFHNEYERLMRHWHDVIPGAIYDVSYEALTHDPETEIRKLLAACDLEWQQRCLDFDKTGGVVRTASAYQARQPMYTSSVRLWEKYQPFIQPMLEELNPAG